MAVLGVTQRAAAKEHAGALQLPSAGDLTPSARRVLAGVWAYRTGAERQAARRFQRLAAELRGVGALPAVSALAEQAVEDERRHAVLCAEMAAAYGGAAEPQGADDAAPIGPADLALHERVLYEVVAFCCVTETLNTSLMTVARERARVPEVRRALRVILRDEVRHAKLGWAHLAAARAQGMGGFIAEQLPRMLAGAVQEELFSPSQASSDAGALERHGELCEAQRLAIFEHATRDILIPGFERHGVDTRPLRAWIAEMRRLPQHH